MASPAAGNTILAADFNTVFPEGSIIPFAGKSIPTDFLECDGSAVSRSTYSGLFAALCPSGTFTVTIASPAVFSKTGHGLVAGDKIHFTTSGALPTGLSTNTDYYVISTGLTADNFRVALSPEGTVVNTSGSQSGTHTLYFSNWGRGDGSTTFNLPDLRSKTVIGKGQSTMTLSFEPGAVNTGTEQVTIPNYTFPSQGQAVVLTTTGSLPTGLSLATTYYIIRVDSTHISFATSLVNANAGTAINLTGTGSGVHTMTFTGVSRTLLGENGGEETHELSKGEIPDHTHTLKSVGGSSTGSNYGYYPGNSFGADQVSGSVIASPLTTDTPHNIMQPFAVVRWIIRAKTYA